MSKINAFEISALLNVLAGARELIEHASNTEKDAGYRTDMQETIEEIGLAIKSLNEKLRDEATP